jgi:putative ABC transport system ATP-binding protein
VKPSAVLLDSLTKTLSALGETALTRLRRAQIGFVFQSFNLMPSLTAAQNVELPLRLAGRKPAPAATLAAPTAVGLADRARHRPANRGSAN